MLITGLCRMGQASVVVPIDKLSILVTIAFSRIVFHEKLSKKAGAGVVLITAGTVMLAWSCKAFGLKTISFTSGCLFFCNYEF